MSLEQQALAVRQSEGFGIWPSVAHALLLAVLRTYITPLGYHKNILKKMPNEFLIANPSTEIELRDSRN